MLETTSTNPLCIQNGMEFCGTIVDAKCDPGGCDSSIVNQTIHCRCLSDLVVTGDAANGIPMTAIANLMGDSSDATGALDLAFTPASSLGTSFDWTLHGPDITVSTPGPGGVVAYSGKTTPMAPGSVIQLDAPVTLTSMNAGVPGTLTLSGSAAVTMPTGSPDMTVTPAGHPPVITDVEPLIAGVGEAVTFTGTYLFPGGTNEVIFAGPTAAGVVTTDITFSGPNMVTTHVPDGAVNGLVSWKNSGGTTTWSKPFQVNYVPKVVSVTPTSGPSGTMVTFVGTHLENVDTTLGLFMQETSGSLVLVNGMNGGDFPVVVVDATKVTAVMPSFDPHMSSPNLGTLLMKLRDHTAGTSGNRAANVGSFTVTGAAPYCP